MRGTTDKPITSPGTLYTYIPSWLKLKEKKGTQLGLAATEVICGLCGCLCAVEEVGAELSLDLGSMEKSVGSGRGKGRNVRGSSGPARST